MREISVWFIVDVIIKKIWFILLTIAVLAGSAFVVNSYFVDPIYAASSAVIGSNGAVGSEYEEAETTSSNKINSSDLASSLNMIDTYVDTMKTNAFYEAVVKRPEIVTLGYDATQLRQMVTVEKRSEYSLFIDVTVMSKNPKHAITIANSIASAIPDYIVTVLPGGMIFRADNSVSAKLVSPQTFRDTVLFGFVGAVLSIVLFILLAAADNAIKGEEDLENRYDIPILGVVPSFEPIPAATKGGTKQ